MCTSSGSGRRHAGVPFPAWISRTFEWLRLAKRQEPRRADVVGGESSRQGAVGLPAVIGLVTIDACLVQSLSLALQAAGFPVRRLSEDVEQVPAEELTDISVFIVCGSVCPQVYQTLRRRSSARILALVPGGGEAEVLRALSAGADDSQKLGISEQEIAARIHALLRRAGKPRSAGQV
ncbi:MAG: hypothetical protein ACP5TV_07280 [Anaerolineae bacterium]